MDVDEVRPDVTDNTSTLLQLSEEDVIKMTFESEHDAFQFYSRYAYVIGFSIRKDSTHKDKQTGEIWDRTFLCSCAGFRKKEYLEMPNRQREHRALTRCGCLAKFRVKLDKVNSRYVVTNFTKDHNHSLSPMYGISQLHTCKHVGDGHKDGSPVVRSAGVNSSRIMEIFTRETSGNHIVGVTRKDSYKGISHDRQVEISSGHVKVALAYLNGKSDGDPMFFFQHTVDDDKRLDNLFWTDGRSRAEFAVFGDVLIFDTTYKTNSCEFPLIILAGVNNHLKTCIFGAALVQNESIDSYTWVLRTFLNVMNNKRPLSVVTDGNKSMQGAIAEVFPDSWLRLCGVHLQQNAGINVKINDFNDIFSRYMSLECSIDEFEVRWKEMVVQYGLEDQEWITEVYEMRHLWAEAYLHGHFFGCVKSTKCCEGMNAFLNRSLERDITLIDFVRDYHKGLDNIRINIVNQELRTNYTTLVLTSALTNLEKHASMVYTREVFMKIQKQINLQATLSHQQVVPHSDGSRTYIIADYNVDGLLRHVLFQEKGLDLSCDCKMFESSGIPCKHLLYVLKCERVGEIPPSCINERWTTAISKDLCNKHLSSATADEMEIARHSYISSKCNEMGFYAKQTSQGYKEVIDGVAKLTAHAKELWMLQMNTTQNEADSSQPIEFDICWIPRLPSQKENPKKK